jgi:hypothetical protein
MALKITKQIGTNQGITNEAYVRIEQYNIDKANGNLNINTSMYLNEETAVSASKTEYNSWNAPVMMGMNTAQNVNYPMNYSFPLTSSVTTTEPTYTPSSSWSAPESGSMPEMTTVMITGSVEVTKYLIDLSSIHDNNIFAVAYPLLKTQLEAIAGSGKVVDC